ncbi:MAG: nucleotidyltransferase family protein [Planctomycetes bacterium]|nr:nucleotidyltransferase family protein [Planctomycetota bacterium]
MEQHDPLVNRSFAIVPAAGRSRRMRQDKLLLPWRNTTVIGSLLAAWRTSDVDEVIVVMRQDQSELLTLCGNATVVIPPIAPPEMKDSVLAALRHIRKAFSPAETDVWLLAPADMPQLDPSVANQVLAAHDPDSPAIIVPTTSGKRGHPVLFPWSFASLVETLSDTEGVNALLERCPVRELECRSRSIHGDLDTPDDYERLRDETGR